MALSQQELSDREEIRDLHIRWALAVDVGDWDAFESCYTSDVLIEFSEIGYQGSTGSGHREFLEASQPYFAAMHHVISNTSFLELTLEAARTRSSVFAATRQHDGNVFFIGAWYHDTLRKEEGRWKIARRYAEKVYDHNVPPEFLVPAAGIGEEPS